MNTLGDRIRAVRLEKKLTQEQLGKKVGVGKSSVSQWESGLTKSLAGGNLLRLAEALDVKPTWLETGKGEKYWKEATGYLDGYYNIEKSVSRAKLDEILDTADRAMDDTGKRFNETERIDLYFEAIEFALRRDFSPQFVKQYMEQLVKERKEDKD